MRTTTALGLLLLATATPTFASSSGSYQLQLFVPVACRVSYAPTPGSGSGEAALGKVSEYCNSPTGYQVRMLYPAGSLRGVTMRINGSAIVLDGSGSAVIDTAPGAASRRFELVGTPGRAKVDPSMLSFAIETR